jgi:long-chain acyl-CoA synthetase
VRRSTIGERYSALVSALYSGRASVPVEATVAFEDGRTTVIRADLKIREAEVFDRVQLRPAA